MRGQHFDNPALAAAYNSALESGLLTSDRQDRLDQVMPARRTSSLATAIDELATAPPWAPLVSRL